MTHPALLSTFATTHQGLQSGAPLNAGGSLPWVGLGVSLIHGDVETERVVRTAIDFGYRCIDTARIYGNERGVGAAVRSCGVPRESLFITTKVWPDDIRAGRVAEAFESSLGRLGLDYVDLFLVHWPVEGKIVDTWKAMEGLLLTGRVKAIGVSNHLVPHLDELLAAGSVVPAVNQFEFHPYLQSKRLVDYCHRRGIMPQAWSPLMVGGPVLQDPVLSEIARAHGKTVAQVILRWDVQRGVLTIPKTAKPARLTENASIFDFVLSTEEMKSIAALDRNHRTGGDPMRVTW